MVDTANNIFPNIFPKVQVTETQTQILVGVSFVTFSLRTPSKLEIIGNGSSGKGPQAGKPASQKSQQQQKSKLQCSITFHTDNGLLSCLQLRPRSHFSCRRLRLPIKASASMLWYSTSRADVNVRSQEEHLFKATSEWHTAAYPKRAAELFFTIFF